MNQYQGYFLFSEFFDIKNSKTLVKLIHLSLQVLLASPFY